jgi:hypothetical protein
MAVQHYTETNTIHFHIYDYITEPVFLAEYQAMFVTFLQNSRDNKQEIFPISNISLLINSIFTSFEEKSQTLLGILLRKPAL